MYWTGFAKWLLARTDNVPWRHRDETSRLRACLLEVGEALVGLRGTAATRPLASALERLSWHLQLAGERRLLSRGDLDRAHQAVNTVRGMLHLPRTPVPPIPREEPTH